MCPPRRLEWPVPFQQYSQDSITWDAMISGGKEKRCVIVNITCFEISPSRYQHFSGVGRTMPSSSMQWGPVVKTTSIHVCSKIQQQLNDGSVVCFHSGVQSGRKMLGEPFD